MDKRYCEDCYYSEVYDDYDACDNYIQFSEQSADSEINNIIEQGRIAFRVEWFEYIEAWNS